LTGHPTSFKRNIAPNPIRVALNVLFPWSVAANLRGRKRYPGIYAGTIGLLRGKAKRDTLKDWSSGRRIAPQWFIALLRAELLARRHAIDEALRSLDEYRGGRGHGAGLHDYWRDKRNRAIEEARKARQAP
jgi:hypothetical protein